MSFSPFSPFCLVLCWQYGPGTAEYREVQCCAATLPFRQLSTTIPIATPTPTPTAGMENTGHQTLPGFMLRRHARRRSDLLGGIFSEPGARVLLLHACILRYGCKIKTGCFRSVKKRDELLVLLHDMHASSSFLLAGTDSLSGTASG